ncbi:MAG TPA: serine hydrolase, partial [Streptomyces sp.]
RDLAFSGLHAATDAIARLGLLHLRGGVWRGQRLLPASWVAEATRPHIGNADGTSEGAASDWQQGYGFQFWMSRHGYRGDGAFGQFCLVLPEYDAVVAMTAATERMQAVLDLAWEHLLPAFGPSPLAGRDEQDAALRDRLSRLALPPVMAKPAPPADPAAWSAARTPEGGVCADQPALAEVGVAADGDGWVLSLTVGGTRLTPRFEGPGWTVEATPPAPHTPHPFVPGAVSAGWTDADTLVAEVVFLETPHRLALTCSLTTRTFTARWRTKPLRGEPLAALRAPRG